LIIFFEKLAFNQVHCSVVVAKLFIFIILVYFPCNFNNMYPYVKTTSSAARNHKTEMRFTHFNKNLKRNISHIFKAVLCGWFVRR